MIMSRFVAAATVLALFAPSTVFSAMPTNPVQDPNFLILQDGTNLRSIKVSGTSLGLTKGRGNSFGSSQQTAYNNLKSASQSQPNHPVQWVFMDLDSHQVIAQSANPSVKHFGASVSKIFVAATLLDKQNGELSSSQKKLMADMLVVSSNSAWTSLQAQIGNGNSDLGRQANYHFTQRMGYTRTRGFQGYWGDVHGNELTADELVAFLYDTYHGHYPGAETVWKFMHTCRTGASRGLKYIPSSIYVGGKTGTYDGATVNPETGRDENPDGSAYKVRVRHHTLVFNVGGRQYGLAVLANSGSDESSALLAGGLLREYTNYHQR